MRFAIVLTAALLATATSAAFGVTGRELLFFAAALAIAARLRPQYVEPWATRALLVLSVACAALSAADAFLRAREPEMLRLGPRPEHSLLARYPRLAETAGIEIGDFAQLPVPTATAETRFVRFATDEFGFRNEPGAGRRPIDVLVLGDSNAVGPGTSQDLIWPAQLDMGRTYNLGASGNAWHAQLTFELESPRLELAPGARLVWMLCVDDVDESYADEAPREPPPSALRRARVALDLFERDSVLGRWREWAALHVLRRIPERSRWLESRRLPDGSELVFYLILARHRNQAADKLGRAAHRAGLARALLETAALARARGLAVDVVIAPSKEEVFGWLLDGQPPWSNPPSGFAAMACSFAREASARCLDLGPAFRSESRRRYEADGSLLWWRDDYHWNEAGQALAAREIAAWLRAEITSTPIH